MAKYLSSRNWRRLRFRFVNLVWVLVVCSDGLSPVVAQESPRPPVPVPPVTKPDEPKPVEPKPVPAPPASVPRPAEGTANPLQLSAPDAPPTLYYDREGRRITEPRQGQQDFQAYKKGADRKTFDAPENLPYFAYSFFSYSRQLIQARRNLLQQQPDSRFAAGTATTPTAATAAAPPLSPTTARVVTPSAESGEPPVNALGGEFADPLTQLNRNVVASIPLNYSLAPGDRLTIRYSSPTLALRELTRTLDANGNVLIDGVGQFNLTGQTLERAERILQKGLLRYYRNVEAQVTLKELRTINVTVTGDAFAPGTYTVPSVATAFNIVYAAGGPTEEGSLRRIEVLRAGRRVGSLDFYRFLTGNAQPLGDVPLQTGDIINVPARLSRIFLRGEVRRSAIFELTETETLRDALRYAGGVKASGATQRAQIRTVEPGAARILRDLDLGDPDQLARVPLFDGDVVDVFSLRDLLANAVTIEGAIEQPGDYAIAPGMRVRDLVQRARGLVSEANVTRADLYRWQPDNTLALVRVDLEKAMAGDETANVTLERWDRLRVFTRREVEWAGRREVTVRGAVQKPGVYDRTETMRVRDLLLLAGGPTTEAFKERAYLLRQRPDTTFAYQTINVTEALKGDPAHDLLIEDNDVLAIYRVNEAQFQPEHVVAVRGEVVSPGLYPRGESMKVSDLLQLAGGVKPSTARSLTVAHARTGDLLRNSPNSLSDGKSPSNPLRPNENTKPDEQFRPPVTINLDSRGLIAPADDILLEDGDVVTLQSVGGYRDRVELVYVRGAVNRPGPVVLRSNETRLSDAIREAGGLRSEAFAEGTEFTRRRELIGTENQRDIALLVSRLNDALNQDTFQREQAKADLERVKAIGEATATNNTPLVPGIPIGGGPSPTASNVAQNLPQRDLVSPPRRLGAEELAPSGNLAIDLPLALKKPNGNEDVLLKDGDTITIPETPSTVQVVGAVINGRPVVFEKGQKADYYIDRVGGYTVDAAKDRIVVIRYGGGILPLSKVKEIRPGDVILVPTRVLTAKISRGGNTFENLIRSVAGTALTIRLLETLFD